MNKSDLRDLIATQMDISKVSAAKLVQAVFDEMGLALERGEHVLISDFGSFRLSVRKGFDGVNPKTGESMHVPSTRVASFKCGRGLKLRLNPERAQGYEPKVDGGDGGE